MRTLAALLALGAADLAYADHPAVDFGSGTSGPITTIPAATLPKGEATFSVRTRYVRSERLPDEELQSRAGRHIHAHSADYLLSPSIAAGYGITDDFTVALSLPYVHRENIRAGEHGHAGGAAVNTVSGHGDSSGIGDLTVLGKYRFGGRRQNGLRAAALFGVKLPTGHTRRIDSQGERFDAEHQPGSGSWDPLLGAALTLPFERFSVDASMLYTLATEGSQDTELGDRASYSLGVSYRIGVEEHHHGDTPALPHHSAWDAVVELNGEWEDKQRTAGLTDPDTGGTVVYLSPGVRFSSPGGWSAVLSIGFPIAQRIRLSHPERDYRVVAGLGWAL